jgi:predicted murein hydrolase (TIGR00659 family)
VTRGIGAIWVYLATSPLLGLVVTLATYVVATTFYRRTRGFPLANPVLLSVASIATLLEVGHIPYARYFEGAQFVHFLLGPATVALAVPLFENAERVRRAAPAIAVGLVCGSLTAVLSAVVIARALGASDIVLRSLAPKSVTTPIAMGISEKVGGLPSLTAALVILTGITGAMLFPVVFEVARIADWRARGLGVGTAAHGIGTARAIMLSSPAAAFSSLAMGVNAILSAALVPPILALLLGR